MSQYNNMPAKQILLYALLTFSVVNAFAQKQSFDVFSFDVPKGWQQLKREGSLQLSVTDSKTGAYAIALITSTVASNADAEANFNNDWERFIKGAVKVEGEPNMSAPTKESGWDIISGAAHYTEQSTKGMATLLTATGGGQMTSVILMTNARQYQEDLLIFLNSLKLQQATETNNAGEKPSNSGGPANASLAGLWVFYNTESSGYANGLPQLTGGYMRREYLLKPDGSYVYRAKNWMVYVRDILFVYETGTYKVQGNQVTLTPKKGSGGWWTKVTNDTKAWGKPVRASADYKMESVTYVFEYYYFEGSQENVLILKSKDPTVRDGADNNDKGVQVYRYTSRSLDNSLIDFPPGFVK